jgi:hypothetical protein
VETVTTTTSRSRLGFLLTLVVAASLSMSCAVHGTRLVPRLSLRAPPMGVMGEPTGWRDPEPDPSRAPRRLFVMVRGEW